MVKKLSIRFRMKPVIDALKEGKKTWSDLRKLDIPEKTLERILKDYLEFFGLVRKEGDYWFWCENARSVFSSKGDYDLAIEHSRKLLPAFQDMLDVDVRGRDDTLYSLAKEHLRSYPEIHKPLEKLEETLTEENKKLLLKYDPEFESARWDPCGMVPIIDRMEPKNPGQKEIKDRLKRVLEIYREFSGGIFLLKLKIENGEPLQGKCSVCPKVKIMKEA